MAATVLLSVSLAVDCHGSLDRRHLDAKCGSGMAHDVACSVTNHGGVGTGSNQLAGLSGGATRWRARGYLSLSRLPQWLPRCAALPLHIAAAWWPPAAPILPAAPALAPPGPRCHPHPP